MPRLPSSALVDPLCPIELERLLRLAVAGGPDGAKAASRICSSYLAWIRARAAGYGDPRTRDEMEQEAAIAFLGACRSYDLGPCDVYGIRNRFLAHARRRISAAMGDFAKRDHTIKPAQARHRSALRRAGEPLTMTRCPLADEAGRQVRGLPVEVHPYF